MRYQTLTRALLIPVVGALTMTACANSDSNNTASGNDCVTGADVAAVAASDGGGAATTAPTTGTTGTNTGKTYTIAFLGALSGNNPQLGINEANAVQLAVKQANDAGTLPFTLKYTSSDDEGAPDKAPAAAQKLIDDPSVVAVVGPPFSGTTKAAEPALSDAGLLSVSPSATNPALTSQGFKTFFRVVPPDDAQGQEAAALLQKYAKSVYLVDDTSEYGKGLADVIQKELGSTSIKVTREGVSDKTQDYSSIAQKVKNANVDAMYYAGYYQGASLFAKSLKAVGYSCLAMSDDGTNDDQFIKGAQDSAEGWLFTCPCADARVDPKAKSFLDAYKTEFNADPGTYSPESYDAANAIIAAMSTISGDVTRDKVVEAVKKVDYAGLTKQVKFEPNGEVSGKTIFVYGVDNGKRVLKGTTTDLLK
ncbi:MAG TPA: branched-chain amino acid ABC transporter substrate-binding protein [Mycobacteriales bacterium]